MASRGFTLRPQRPLRRIATNTGPAASAVLAPNNLNVDAATLEAYLAGISTNETGSGGPGFANFAANSFAANAPGSPRAPATVQPFIQNTYQPMNIPIPILQSMDTNARTHFKPSLDAINAKKIELYKLAQNIKDRQGPLESALQNKRGMNPLAMGTKNFRGKNAPQVYVAHDEKGELLVRGNFTEQGYPFRVTNPNSFNAVLRNMKAKRRSVSGRLSSLKTATNLVQRYESAYAAKQAELAGLVKKLQKNHEEYLSKRAREARASRRTILPSAAPTTRLTANARRELVAPRQTQPGFFGRLFGRSGGATRKRRGSRKTRKTSRR